MTTEIQHKPQWFNRNRKSVVIGVSIITTILLVALFLTTVPFIIQTFPKTETGELYFQSITSDWGNGNYVLSQSFSSGEGKSNDMWHHPDNFISPPLKQNFAINTIIVTIYHQIMSADGSNLKVEFMFIDSIGQVQTIATKFLQSTENSRVTSSTASFLNLHLLKNERFYVRVTVTTPFAWDWYWGNSAYPSHITYEGIPQYEGMPHF
jgi:hypothetical protein